MDLWMIIIMSIMVVLVAVGYLGENRLKKTRKTDDQADD